MQVVKVPPEQFGVAALASLTELLSELQSPVVALPTGVTPVPLYEEMARQRFAFPSGAQLFALDEYCYPKPHAGTNAAFFRRYLPATAFPGIVLARADADDPAAEIEGVCKVLRAAGGLDVAVVGIGANGHIAFNEPGSTRRSPCRVVELTASTQAQVASHWHPPPIRGMTLGMDEIIAARSILLLASDSQKSAILATALSGDESSDVPASFLQRHPRFTVVCETDPSAQLSG